MRKEAILQLVVALRARGLTAYVVAVELLMWILGRANGRTPSAAVPGEVAHRIEYAVAAVALAVVAAGWLVGRRRRVWVAPVARPRKTDAERAAVQTRILDAALGLVLSGGAAAAGMRAVARGAGMSPLAPYTYYPSRQAVLDALAEQETASLVAGQKRVEKRAATGEIATSMREALLLYPRFERDDPEIFALGWVRPDRSPEDPARAQLRLRATVEHLARHVAIGIERGAFRKHDPLLAASAVLSMVTALLVLFHTRRIADPRLRDRLVREVLDAAMGYLGARAWGSPRKASTPR